MFSPNIIRTMVGIIGGAIASIHSKPVGVLISTTSVPAIITPITVTMTTTDLRGGIVMVIIGITGGIAATVEDIIPHRVNLLSSVTAGVVASRILVLVTLYKISRPEELSVVR